MIHDVCQDSLQSNLNSLLKILANCNYMYMYISVCSVYLYVCMSRRSTNLQPKFIFIQLHSLELHVIRKCFICKNYLMTWHGKQIYLLIVFSEPQILFANRQLIRLSKDNSTNLCLSYVENANFANRTIQNILFKCKKCVDAVSWEFRYKETLWYFCIALTLICISVCTCNIMANYF